MPIYEYACTNCEHRVDALQKVADAPLVDCPQCGKPALKRLLSAPRFRLKGQGWYETDFKKDNQRNLHGDKEDKPAKDAPAKDAPAKDAPAKDKPADRKGGKAAESAAKPAKPD